MSAAARGIELLTRAHSSLAFGLLRNEDFVDRFGPGLRHLGLRGIEVLYRQYEFVENLVRMDWVMILAAVALAVVLPALGCSDPPIDLTTGLQVDIDAEGNTVLDIQPPRKSDKPKAEPARLMLSRCADSSGAFMSEACSAHMETLPSGSIVSCSTIWPRSVGSLRSSLL